MLYTILMLTHSVLQSTLLGWALLLSSHLPDEEMGGAETLGKLPKAAQLAVGRAGVQTQAVILVVA